MKTPEQHDPWLSLGYSSALNAMRTTAAFASCFATWSFGAVRSAESAMTLKLLKLLSTLLK
eukprot:9663556-Heterocapsa_arctica.AAC.1